MSEGGREGGRGGGGGGGGREGEGRRGRDRGREGRREVGREGGRGREGEGGGGRGGREGEGGGGREGEGGKWTINHLDNHYWCNNVPVGTSFSSFLWRSRCSNNASWQTEWGRSGNMLQLRSWEGGSIIRQGLL